MAPGKTESLHYTVEPFDVDFTGRLSWNVLGKHILSSAERHAEARGFNHFSINGHRCLWVLSRMAFEMDSWPRVGENYTITTWIRRYYHYFIDRCFDIVDAQGHTIGHVFSIWAMINEQSRKPEMLTKLFGSAFDTYLDTERPCNIKPFNHIRVETDVPAYSRRTYYSDIDENNHVNSIRYIEFVMDSFPKEVFGNKQVRRLEIAYNSESYCGNKLSFYTHCVDEDNYNIIIKKDAEPPLTKNDDEIICHSSVWLVPLQTD